MKDFAEAMMESNKKRDAYIDKEQDKFFVCLNRQCNEINSLKEQLEWLELRTKVLELANELMLELLDDMATQLCFCICVEGAQIQA